MDSLIVIAIILYAVIGIAKKSGKIKTARPGQATAPQKRDQWAAPAGKRNELAEEGKKASSGPETVARPQAPEPLKPVDALREGESRVCEAGAIGGSLEHNIHQGFEAKEAERPLTQHPTPRQADTQAASLVSATRLSAEEMRRAVVLAEILKRPSERRVGGGFR